MKKYQNYKNSNIEWIGQIPKHWEILKGNRFLQEAKERNNGFKREIVLSLSYGNIKVKTKQEQTGLMPESYETYQLVNEGDIIFRPTDLQNDKVSLRSAISNFDGIISSAYINLRAKNNADKKFCSYLFRAIDNNKIIYGLGSGLRQNISFDDFKRFIFPLPPLSEQTQIANFLDKKTKDLETAISQKQKLILLLEERKQILIQDAVTKGINKTTKLKKSGIEWIGQIPEHWEVKRLKYVCEAYGRIGFRGYTTSDLVDKGEGAITISPSNIKGELMNFSKSSYLTWAKYEQSPEIQIFENDILIVKTGSTFGKVGFVKNLNEKATINPQLLVLKKIKLNNHFLYEVINSLQIQNQIKQLVIGSTIPTISENKILNIKIAFPPKNEMEEIVKFCNSIKAKYNEAISLQKKQIKKLKEYKSVLIDAAVTGKIRVND